MQRISLSFTAYIVPKKNAFRAGVKKDGTPYQYRATNAKASQKALHGEAKKQVERSPFKLTKKPVEIRAIFMHTEGDCVGLLETVLDALEGVVYAKDKQVGSCVFRWDYDGQLARGETCRLLCTELDGLSSK